ncbi:IclR family transcriptional regulator [Ramlibacter sp.]|uniref:IclR family transcriptional regulator n=1 Tax=Ramlibacter sp. TaxID=1917967 RepID=UPI003D150596
MAPASSPASRSGTQSIERAAFLMREIASRSNLGWGLRDLAQHCGLDPGTVHRMLKCLVRERLVQQRASDSRYFIGPLNFELGLAVPHRVDLMDATQAALRRVVRVLPRISVVGFLRSGDDCVCIGRAGHPTYTRTESSSQMGQRFPLLTKAAGVAIVVAMRPDEMRAVIARNRERLAHFGTPHLARVDELLKASQRNGYALSEGLLWHGVNSIAMAFGPPGEPAGSITVSSWAADVPTEMLRKVLPDLREAVAALAEESVSI